MRRAKILDAPPLATTGEFSEKNLVILGVRLLCCSSLVKFYLCDMVQFMITNDVNSLARQDPAVRSIAQSSNTASGSQELPVDTIERTGMSSRQGQLLGSTSDEKKNFMPQETNADEIDVYFPKSLIYKNIMKLFLDNPGVRFSSFDILMVLQSHKATTSDDVSNISRSISTINKTLEKFHREKISINNATKSEKYSYAQSQGLWLSDMNCLRMYSYGKRM